MGPILKIRAMQIDLIKIENKTAVCNLYTGDRCVRIVMTKESYLALLQDGFFIRDGKTADSAGVINTTQEYRQVRYVYGLPQLMPAKRSYREVEQR